MYTTGVLEDPHPPCEEEDEVVEDPAPQVGIAYQGAEVGKAEVEGTTALCGEPEGEPEADFHLDPPAKADQREAYAPGLVG